MISFLKRLWITIASTYTCTVLVCIFFINSGFIGSLTTTFLAQTFVLAVSLSVIQVAWQMPEKVENSSLPTWFVVALDMLIRVLLVLVVVFIEGGLFGFFPFSVEAFWAVTPLCLIIFILSYLTLYFSFLRVKKTAEEINKKISKRK